MSITIGGDINSSAQGGKGGEVRLNGQVHVGGNINTSSKGGKGGHVILKGNQIHIEGNIDTSGAEAGNVEVEENREPEFPPVKRARKNQIVQKSAFKKEVTEQKKLKRNARSSRPFLRMNGGSSIGTAGQFSLYIFNNGGKAILKDFRVIEGDVTIQTANLPYELKNGQVGKIILKASPIGPKPGLPYKFVIEFQDTSDFEYMAVVSGSGSKSSIGEFQRILKEKA